MFGKVRWSQNMFLWIRMMFCSHLAYPKPHFVYRSILKLIGNRVWFLVARCTHVNVLKPLLFKIEGTLHFVLHGCRASAAAATSMSGASSQKTVARRVSSTQRRYSSRADQENNWVLDINMRALGSGLKTKTRFPISFNILL